MPSCFDHCPCTIPNNLWCSNGPPTTPRTPKGSTASCRVRRRTQARNTAALSLAGGASGILLAYWSVQSLVAFMSRGGLWPSHLAVHLDLRVLVFTVAA